MLDIAIKGGAIVTLDGVYPADIGLEGDKIALVAAPGSLPAARQEIIAEEMLVMPGAIDIHFHVRAPSYPERATFPSETQRGRVRRRHHAPGDAHQRFPAVPQ